MERKSRLLIVDDEPEIVELLQYVFSEHAEVDSAYNGRQAIEKINAGHFHAILSDVKMPEMDGFELLRWVRQNEMITPFVVLTGHGERDLTIQALRLGAYDFVDKPWDQKDLERRVLSAIELGMSYESLVHHNELSTRAIKALVKVS